MFSCNLPSALLAEWLGSFTCYCSNMGWNGYWNKSQHRKLTMEKKCLPPLLQGLKPAVFWWQVWRSNHWAIPAPQWSGWKQATTVKPQTQGPDLISLLFNWHHQIETAAWCFVFFSIHLVTSQTDVKMKCTHERRIRIEWCQTPLPHIKLGQRPEKRLRWSDSVS